MSLEHDVLEDRSMQQKHGTSAPIQEGFETDAIKEYIVLEMALRIIDHDVKAIGLSKIKLPRLYEAMLRAVQDRVLLEMANIRRMFRKQGIKIYEECQEQDGLLAKYVCRGYHHQIFMLWGLVKAECERVLRKYMSV